MQETPRPDLMVCDNAKGTESALCKGGGAAVPLSRTESRVWEAGRAQLKVLPKGAAPPSPGPARPYRPPTPKEWARRQVGRRLGYSLSVSTPRISEAPLSPSVMVLNDY